MTLESNEYQLYMLKFALNVVQKLCDLLGGREEVIKRSHWITGGRGGGGRSRWAKKGSPNLLTLPKLNIVLGDEGNYVLGNRCNIEALRRPTCSLLAKIAPKWS